MKKIIIAMLIVVLVSLTSLNVVGYYCKQSTVQDIPYKGGPCQIIGERVYWQDQSGNLNPFKDKVWVAEDSNADRGFWFKPQPTTQWMPDPSKPPTNEAPPPDDYFTQSTQPSGLEELAIAPIVPPPEEEKKEEKKEEPKPPKKPETDVDCSFWTGLCTYDDGVEGTADRYYYRNEDTGLYYELTEDEFNHADEVKDGNIVDEDGNVIIKLSDIDSIDPTALKEGDPDKVLLDDMENDIGGLENLLDRYGLHGPEMAYAGGILWNWLGTAFGFGSGPGSVWETWNTMLFVDVEGAAPWLTGRWDDAICWIATDQEESYGSAVVVPGQSVPSIWNNAESVHISYINRTTGKEIDEYMVKFEYEISSGVMNPGECIEFELTMDGESIDVNGDGKTNNQDYYYVCDESVSKIGENALYKRYFEDPEDNEFCIEFLDKGQMTQQIKALMDSDKVCSKIVSAGETDDNFDCGICFMAHFGGSSGRGPHTSEDSRIPDAPNDYP